MKSLLYDLINPFDDIKITDKRLDPFAKQVILNLTSLNIGTRYTDIIAELTGFHTPFHAKISKILVDDALSVGQTEFRMEVVYDFQEFASENIGPVKKKYKLNHPRFLEFYPDLLNDIYVMNKSNSLITMERYASAMLAHHADWDVADPIFVSVAEGFPARYTAASDAQVTGKQVKNTDRGVRNTHRPELNESLFAAYNLAKYWTRGSYAGMKAIFDRMENLIPNGRHTIETFGDVIDNNITMNVTSENWDGTYYALCRNTGNTKLAFGLEPLATTTVGVNGFVLNKSKSKSSQVILMGAPGDKFLNVTNLDLNDPGAWEVEIYFK